MLLVLKFISNITDNLFYMKFKLFVIVLNELLNQYTWTIPIKDKLINKTSNLKK
jgi:hypothetical protein